MVYREQLLQMAIVKFFNYQYPKLHGLLICVNNNSKSLKEGRRNRKMGVIAGVSDLIFFYMGKTYFIELKVDKGVQSKNQKKWEAIITSQKFQYFIVRTLPEFERLIVSIITKRF